MGSVPPWHGVLQPPVGPYLHTYRVDDAAAVSVVAEIEAAGGTARAVRADNAVEADVLAAFAAADAMGTLTALVANAGMTGPKARINELEHFKARRTDPGRQRARHDRVCPRPCGASRRCTSSSGGSIVLMGSAASRIGGSGEYVDYAASKGAVDSLGVGLGREVASKGSGWWRATRSDRHRHPCHRRPARAPASSRMRPVIPIDRAGTADEIAAAVVWLLGDEAGYCTGSILDVSGGR